MGRDIFLYYDKIKNYVYVGVNINNVEDYGYEFEFTIEKKTNGIKFKKAMILIGYLNDIFNMKKYKQKINEETDPNDEKFEKFQEEHKKKLFYGYDNSVTSYIINKINMLDKKTNNSYKIAPKTLLQNIDVLMNEIELQIRGDTKYKYVYVTSPKKIKSKKIKLNKQITNKINKILDDM